ncbi:SseB family protein [Paracoccus nototheniae]|uniref:SseB family protein n=1 Tax=Paracoccus nototheniae TaxID=2489002 RepID=A0ABW4DSA8_9RHOB|nr:SseB family protein [Paracoccus nototheniae]
MSALDDLAPVPFHDADAPQRARMLSRLADTQLSVALLREPVHDEVELQIFDLDGVRTALACDAEDRLADFFGKPVAYAALPGRILAGLLKSDGAGLLVNPGHPSEMLLDATMLDWLTGALQAAPEADEAHLQLSAPDRDVADALAAPLAERLADLRGMVAGAALVGVQGAGHAVMIAGAPVDRQPAIAKALSEALAFLPAQPGGVDITFAQTAPPPGALLFDLSAPVPEEPASRPDRPPILR